MGKDSLSKAGAILQIAGQIASSGMQGPPGKGEQLADQQVRGAQQQTREAERPTGDRPGASSENRTK